MKKMKTFVLSVAAMMAFATTNAQYSQDFEGGQPTLNGNCWTFTGLNITNTPGDVITGTGSLYSNPPSGSSRDMLTPGLNITNSNFSVFFNYKVSSKISGNATRTIEVGLMDNEGNFTSLETILLDKNSPTTVLNFNKTFALASTGARKFVLKLGGAGGDGNSRLIVDDISLNASPLYGTGTCNTAPVAVNDVFTGTIGTVITGNVLTNDNEPNGETMTPAVVVTSLDGVVVMNANGSFTFTPNPGFTGSQTTFTYRSLDNGLDPAYSNTATVTLNYVANAVLPVKLTSFTAALNNNNVRLAWATSTEINASNFVIERSYNGVDYSAIAVVMAYGNSTETKSYQYSDFTFSANSTIIYYRLRQVDIDGRSDLSSTRIIRTAKQDQNSLSILTFPNPVSNELKITIPGNWQNKKVSYEIINLNGQVAARIENGNSSQTETINISKLAPGFYMAKVTCDGQTAQQKIIKQ